MPYDGAVKSTGRRGSPSVRGVGEEPQRHLAPLDERSLVRTPAISDAVFGLVFGMHPRFHDEIVHRRPSTKPADDGRLPQPATRRSEPRIEVEQPQFVQHGGQLAHPAVATRATSVHVTGGPPDLCAVPPTCPPCEAAWQARPSEPAYMRFSGHFCARRWSRGPLRRRMTRSATTLRKASICRPFSLLGGTKLDRFGVE